MKSIELIVSTWNVNPNLSQSDIKAWLTNFAHQLRSITQTNET